MPAWNKICCPIDFSAASRVALDEAAELAWRYGGSLTLLHVRERAPVAAPDVRLPTAQAMRTASLRREQELKTWREYAAPLATTAVDAVIVDGNPATEIVRFATAGEFDVVVMATHGRSREGRALGSIAQTVILDAPCPVVVVHAHASRRALRTHGAPAVALPRTRFRGVSR